MHNEHNILVVAATVAGILWLACGQNPTSPTNFLPPSVSTGLSNSVPTGNGANPTPAPPTAGSGGTMTATLTLSSTAATARVRNSTGTPTVVYLAVYRIMVGNEQELFSVRTKTVPEGFAVIYNDSVPACGRFQADVLTNPPPDSYVFPGRLGGYLAGGVYNTRVPCDPPPPPTCPVVGKPECPSQTWDPIKCKWIGECPKPPKCYHPPC